MKNELKGLWRRFLHFWCPAIVICWGTTAYVTGHDKGQWIPVALGVLITLFGLMLFHYESEKLREEEKDEDTN